MSAATGLAAIMVIEHGAGERQGYDDAMEGLEPENPGGFRGTGYERGYEEGQLDRDRPNYIDDLDDLPEMSPGWVFALVALLCIAFMVYVVKP